MDQTAQSYTTIARLLHWIMALLVLGMIAAGFLMVQDGLARPLRNTLFIFHKNAGVLVLVLIVLRIAYRLVQPPPALPAHLPSWQVRAAGASHLALYALLVVMPVAGYVRVKAGGFPIESLDALGIPSPVPRSEPLAELAKAVHHYAGFVITGIVAVHISAAFYHAILRRDGVFSRIWPPVIRPSK
ncbi:MAG TPA: cytochrome b [Paracoccaceae bacterium]|nr:cytochrome b [Paracoccaceae bacterium]